LAFEKNANFFAENWQKSQKIVVITSVPEKIIFGAGMQDLETFLPIFWWKTTASLDFNYPNRK
jgi:hypothetical protein